MKHETFIKVWVWSVIVMIPIILGCACYASITETSLKIIIPPFCIAMAISWVGFLIPMTGILKK